MHSQLLCKILYLCMKGRNRVKLAASLAVLTGLARSAATDKFDTIDSYLYS